MTRSASNTSGSHSANGDLRFGDRMSFAAAEAYKLLRTNLIFSLPGEQCCKVIAVTSAVRGEGKSTTAINLSFSLAEAGKKVLLIDGDMRLPSVAKSLKIPQKPGLSNILTGQTSGTFPIRKTELHPLLHVISSGSMPSNPSELLGAQMMDTLLRKARSMYDFIVLDLPPVTVVSDALVITPNCDGVLVVVRQGYSRRREVDDAIHLLEYCNANILGYALNDADPKGKYARAGSRIKYDHRYYKRYKFNRYGYEHANKRGNANPAGTDASADV